MEIGCLQFLPREPEIRSREDGVVDLRTCLTEIAANYDRLAGLQTPTQELLKSVGGELDDYLPGGMICKGSGGKGMATYTPWIGFFDPDETSDPQEGIYVVYIFAEDLGSVTLTLNQGMEHLRRQLGDAAARKRLASDAQLIRGHLQADQIEGLSKPLDLGSGGIRQRNYEAGSILAKRYLFDDLPGDEALTSDLHRFLALYGHAIEAKRNLLLGEPGSLGSPSGAADADGEDPLKDFKPKDDADYLSWLQGRMLKKSRRHETLVRQFGEWAATVGFKVSTKVHPRDLVVKRNGHEWLIEVKVVRSGNSTEAVRSALGQLYSYRHFLYSDGREVDLVGLFSEPIGDAYVEFLRLSGIESVWREAGLWVGTEAAERNGLAQIAS